MPNFRIISADEVTQHNNEDSCWIIMNGKVYDVTNFLDNHPAGLKIIIRYAGTDCTTEFDDYNHSTMARVWAEEYLIGQLLMTGASTDSSSTWIIGNLQKVWTWLF